VHRHVSVWQRIQAIAWLAAGLYVSTLPALPAAVSLAAGIGMLISYVSLFALISACRPADWITLARAGLLALVLAASQPAGGLELLPWLACIGAVSADLLDGWVARRTGGSAAGAVLDMEADQAATLILAALAVIACGVGAWALLLPAFRYAFVLLSWLCAWPAHDPKPKGDNDRARAICAATMVLQLIALGPSVPHALRVACLLTAIAALTISYADDVLFLRRRRAAARG
jgi:phosphatidylglycerophosphate synthase